MAYIKKLVIHGFKSFAKKTEIIFSKDINMVVGPNGSGKTNISDALCFVLGRLSIKSMRAAKAKNLIFMGSKYIKPAKEAYVELVFDNIDKAFNIESNEIILKRGVRTNGQSIYKINGETKTRAEIIELLAYAGIDPHGFNIIQQGQIQAIVRMRPEDRIKIIEDVAGISIYESGKEKSLHELEKTEEKLREMGSILRERGIYLNNLEKERAQALKYQELEKTARRARATIIQKKISEKEKELDVLIKSMEMKIKQRDGMKGKCEEIQREIEKYGESIQRIHTHIQKASGFEQEQLHNEVANLRAELEGLRVRKESYENRKEEVERRINEMRKDIPVLEGEIRRLRDESPLIAKKAEELKSKKAELARLEEERKDVLGIRSELQATEQLVLDRTKQLERARTNSSSIIRQLEEASKGLLYSSKDICEEQIKRLEKELKNSKDNMEKIDERILKCEKIISVSYAEIKRGESNKKNLNELDICPLCQSKIGKEHKEQVINDSDNAINKARAEMGEAERDILEFKKTKKELLNQINEFERKINESRREIVVHESLKDKNERLKDVVEETRETEQILHELKQKVAKLVAREEQTRSIDDRYHNKLLEIEEVSSRTEEDLDNTLLYKERELEGMRRIVKQGEEDLKSISSKIIELERENREKNEMLGEFEKKEEELNERFEKMFKERDELQKQTQEAQIKISGMQHETRGIEDQVNYLKVGKARLDAEKEALQMEFSEFVGIELLQGSMISIGERMKKAQEGLIRIGNINMRALEAYEEAKKEYDIIKEKVDVLIKEKEEIMKIIEEIDRKKKRTFMRTFKAINELFTKNFSELLSKGIAYLELEDSEDIFSGGVSIIVKLAKGKYFDVTSLSGGEQSLVALALLFAIQEHKPYHFYIFDEIDAALDKRNSERLSSLLNRYMKSGQYIVITHNDALLANAEVLYGVSKHEGVSKILSLNVKN